MSTNMLRGIAGLLVLAAGSVASANLPKTFTGQGGPIPDNAPAAPLRREIVIPPDNAGAIKGVQLSVTATHSWVGDLTIRLTHKDTGRVVTVVSRPGFTGTGFGSSNDMNGTYVFSDSAPTTFVSAATAASPTIIPSGTYQPLNPLSSFAADPNKFGTWSLEVSDSAASDTGSVSAWSITILNQVPTPGAAALFGLAGLAGIRRRR